MDPNRKLESSFPLNFPHGSSSQPSSSFPVDFPFDGFPQFQLDFPAPAWESGGAEPDQVAVNQPLECLQGNPISPFLYKTFDLVEDPSLDPIISWGENGDTFVVWEPAYLATIVLPSVLYRSCYFDCVAQVRSFAFLQGFRKIDLNKWEFGNEFFLQGSKHLLKNIKRCKSSPHPQQVASEESGPEMERKLRTEKSLILQEMAELQQQQRQTGEYMETIKRKLEASEKRRKQMLSFLVKAVQNPEFIESVVEMKKQSPRTWRKVVKQKTQEQVSSLPFQTEQVEAQELMTGVPVQIGGSEYSNPDNGEFSSLEFGHFVDFPEDLGTDEAFAEFFSSN